MSPPACCARGAADTMIVERRTPTAHPACKLKSVVPRPTGRKIGRSRFVHSVLTLNCRKSDRYGAAFESTSVTYTSLPGYLERCPTRCSLLEAIRGTRCTV